ncbi:acyl-CoA synthetase MbcS [Bacillus sp. E214]|uniref:acyl-CoA synthetase MbcS n=1 Tax=Bacillus sp. E214 TaxID=2587156 RepID=UPI0011E0694A|nr:acyl--CoA ligase [Bacillus sp. E214]
MKREELIAPHVYNLTTEIERYTNDPEKLALKWENQDGLTRSITYKQLVEEANKIGNVFAEAGLQMGDKILVIVPRIIEAYAIYMAALKSGIVLIPCSEMLRAKDLAFRIQHAEARAVVCYEKFTAEIDAVPDSDNLIKFCVGDVKDQWISLDEKVKTASSQFEAANTTRDDIALLSYTSGTTGNPKAVVHTHAWGYAHLKTAAKNWMSINENDLVWATAAPGWQKWVWSPFLSVLGTGATGFVYNGKFNADTFLALLDKYRINVFCCTPTEYRLIVKSENLHKYKLPYLHSAISAGEALNTEVINAFYNQFNVTIRNGYGQTESTLLIGQLKDIPNKPGSMGKATPGNIVEIVDENGQLCQAGEVGNIGVHLSTPALFKEYYKDPERTLSQRKGEYFITGDRALKDEEGFFWFEGRSDDIIISSGYTIGPFEVEDALIKHPAVKECAVVGSPDAIRGNIVKAFIVLTDSYKHHSEKELIADLQSFVKTLTAPYKYPRSIEFTEALPKTTSGKIRHVQLREMELSKD